MKNNNLRNKINLDLLILEYTTKEQTKEATQLKIELINQLINNQIERINLFSYYYDIIKLNDKKQ